MRKVILGLAVSLDGYIEGPNGEYDWCFTDQDYGLKIFFQQIDGIFIGRKSFEMAGAGMFPTAQTYVFSNTLEKVKKGVRLIKGDIVKEVREIKSGEGKNIWLFGGASLTGSLLNAGLVDRLWLSVHPILLGKGKPLFQQIDGRIKLKLVESKTYSTGLVSLQYDVENNN
jgi:dihydrofolate reductase